MSTERNVPKLFFNPRARITSLLPMEQKPPATSYSKKPSSEGMSPPDVLGQTHEQKLVVPSRERRESVSPVPLMVIESVSEIESPSPSESQTPVSRRRVSCSQELSEVQPFDPSSSPSVVPSVVEDEESSIGFPYIPVLEVHEVHIEPSDEHADPIIELLRLELREASSDIELAIPLPDDSSESELPESRSSSNLTGASTPEEQAHPFCGVNACVTCASRMKKLLTGITGQATVVPVGLEETEQDPEE